MLGPGKSFLGQAGNFLRGWGEASSGIDGFSSPSGIAVGGDDRVWVSDAENNFALGFTLPELAVVSAPPEPEVPVESSLPKVPEGLNYEPESGQVINDLEIPLYQLSADGMEWVPVVPESIAALLQPGILPEKDTQGDWVLLSPEGIQLFKWDPLVFIWVSTNPTP